MTLLKTASVLSALWFSGSALAGVPSWTMSESSGQVTVASSGLVRVASRGATLSVGDVITTGAKGRAVIVRGQEYLVVAPNSRIRVADPAKSGGMTQIIEQIGNVVFKIKKMATPHFAVETPFLAAVVKGTTFSVTVTESGASVQVIEGRVEVETRDGGARHLVLPGDIGSVSGKALGRLNIEGRDARTIVSPTEGGSATVPTAELLKADPVAVADVPADPVIAVAVSEPPVRLGPATNGMVSGALVAVTTTVAERVSESAVATPAKSSESATSASKTSGSDSASNLGSDVRKGEAASSNDDDGKTGTSGKNNSNGDGASSGRDKATSGSSDDGDDDDDGKTGTSGKNNSNGDGANSGRDKATSGSSDDGDDDDSDSDNSSKDTKATGSRNGGSSGSNNGNGANGTGSGNGKNGDDDDDNAGNRNGNGNSGNRNGGDDDKSGNRNGNGNSGKRNGGDGDNSGSGKNGNGNGNKGERRSK
ncbi:MAG: FecR domain-containing protein [Sphingomonas sp.]